MDKLYSLNALELKAMIIEKKITVNDLITSVLNRIDETEDKVGSFVTLIEKERAFDLAKESQKRYEENAPRLLEGLPVVCKHG